MKGIIILANGFEDTEAITTIDILRRAKIDITTVAITDDLFIQTQTGLLIKTEKSINEISLNDYQFLIIPGGRAVAQNLLNNPIIDELVSTFEANNKLIATICAAPSLVAKHGYFKGEQFTCYPSFEKYATAGEYIEEKGVVVSNTHITSKAMAYTIDFALAIVEKIKEKEVKEKVAKEIHGCK